MEESIKIIKRNNVFKVKISLLAIKPISVITKKATAPIIAPTKKPRLPIFLEAKKKLQVCRHLKKWLQTVVKIHNRPLKNT